jgi:hypothetical protein
MPSCGVLSLVKAKRFSASPVTGLRLTWTIARPANRNPSVAARLLLDTVFRTVRNLVETGAWPLAELERDCKDAARRAAAHEMRASADVVPAKVAS